MNMMSHSLNLYSSSSASSKTDQIMSRYRPIAPRPELPINPILQTTSMFQRTHQSHLLRNLSPLFSTKPTTRTRKRTRSGLTPLNHKRARNQFFKFSSPCHVASLAPKTQLDIPLQGCFAHGYPEFSLRSLENPTTTSSPASLVTLPLLPYPSSVPVVTRQALDEDTECMIDLNLKAAIPEEKDLLQKLRGSTCSSNVIAPQPVRPVGSSISVGCISEDPGSTPTMQVKRPEEVEEEVESEALPAVVSDSNNRVRLANSAYKELVGQPECVWLDSMANFACRRIGGEVMLDLPDSSVPNTSNGFSCKVKIEWGSNGQKKSSINAPCDVSRLSCYPKDYLFTWRFHTREVSESSSRV